MAANILDGKKRAEEIRQGLKKEIEVFKSSFNAVPKLAALQVDDNSGFSVYINAQKKFAQGIGMEYQLHSMDSGASHQDVKERILSLNTDNSVTGIILQAPLPDAFDFMELASSMLPLKDVEGLHPENKGRLLLKNYKVVPPTAAAALELIKLSGIDLYGKEAVIIGHSRIVGKPLAMLLLDEFATVTVCHIATSERGSLRDHIKRAEVLVAAVGKANIIDGGWIREGAVVIDVGINRVGSKLVGDVEFETARKRASHITPVPGGVGPLTTAMLMQNCLNLFKLQRGQ